MKNRGENNNPKLNPPDFLCIGAQKSGTTWLYENLSMIPDFEMPPLKELHYFNNLGAKGLRLRDLTDYKHYLFLKKRVNYQIEQLSIHKLLWELKYLFGRRTDNWYLSLFHRTSGKLTGDISPAYSILPEQIVQKIHRLIPRTKIIFILRNPIDRAWSHAKMDFERFQKRKIKDVKIIECINHFDSLASTLRSNYIRTLDIWQQYFPADQFFIGFFDDIANEPEVFLKDVLSFLCVDPDSTKFAKALRIQLNRSIDEPIPAILLQYLTKKYEPLINELNSLFGKRF